MEQVGEIDEGSWFYRYVVQKRVAWGFVLGALLLVFAEPTKTSLFLGLWLALAGEALRTWASGTIVKTRVLATEGPYGLTRNPLYVGSFLIGLGVAMMAGSVLVTVLFVACFVPVYRGLVAKEEKVLLERHGEAFAEYCRTVPRFVPRWGVANAPPAPFDVARVLVKHKEWQAWLGLYAVLLYLLLRTP